MRKILSKLALIPACAIFFVPAPGQDTSMFRGGLAHTGVYEATGVLQTPQVKWKFQTGGRVISSPAVLNGIAYVGSADGNLYAIETESGKLKWKFTTLGIVASSPAVSTGVVYFGSYDGNFYAVDAATGKEKWKFKTGGERRFSAKNINGIQPENEVMPDFWDFYLSSPAVWDGKVYFGSGDGNIYALNASSGDLVWKFKTGGVVHTSPAISGGTLFTGGFDTYFYALDADSGKEKWRYKTGEDGTIHNQEGITSSAAVMDGIVYFGCRDSHMYFLDAESGRRVWEFFAGGGWISNSPSVRNGQVYFGSGSDRRFQALDGKTGASIFSEDVGTGTFASTAIAGNLLYLATFSNDLRAIDLTTHKTVWKFQLPSSVQPAANSPLKLLSFYDDRVAFMSRKFQEGLFLSSPVVVGDVIYLGNTDGALYALR